MAGTDGILYIYQDRLYQYQIICMPAYLTESIYAIPSRCPFTTRYHRGVHLLRDTTVVSIYSAIPPRCPFTPRYYRGVHLLRDITAVSIYYAIPQRCPFTTRYYRGVHLLRDTTAVSIYYAITPQFTLKICLMLFFILLKLDHHGPGRLTSPQIVSFPP